MEGITYRDWCVMKFSESGNRLWCKTYDGEGDWDEANSVAIDENNNVYH